MEKYFKDYGYYTGIVTTYDSPYYRIQYEDGEEEDLTFNEVIRWLHPEESKLVEPQSEAKIKIVVGGDLLEAEEEIIVHQTTEGRTLIQSVQCARERVEKPDGRDMRTTKLRRL